MRTAVSHLHLRQLLYMGFLIIVSYSQTTEVGPDISHSNTVFLMRAVLSILSSIRYYFVLILQLYSMPALLPSFPQTI